MARVDFVPARARPRTAHGPGYGLPPPCYACHTYRQLGDWRPSGIGPRPISSVCCLACPPGDPVASAGAPGPWMAPSREPQSQSQRPAGGSTPRSLTGVDPPETITADSSADQAG